jgi:hypothetical protein
MPTCCVYNILINDYNRLMLWIKTFIPLDFENKGINNKYLGFWIL